MVKTGRGPAKALKRKPQGSRPRGTADGRERPPEIMAGEIVEARRPEGKPYVLGKWTYELPSLPIPAREIKTSFSADVIVVGAGASGKAAALSAAEAGARVIQIDRHTTFRYGGGMIGAIDSRLQRGLGILVDKDDACLQLMRHGGNKPDQRLIRLWADHSGAVMDWLMDFTDPRGVTTLMYQWPLPPGFDAKTEYYPEYTVSHVQTDGTSSLLNHSLLLRPMEEAARKKGVDIRYRTRAVQLIRRASGRVTGIVALDDEGQYIRFNARKAVILCTGDYGNNPWMMQKYCPTAAEVALENNIYMTRNEDLTAAPEPLNTGDGHQMAMRIGAVMEPSPHAPMSHISVGPLGNDPFLRVNIEGVRYENEDVPAQSIANSVIRQPGKKAWQIFDGKWTQEIGRMGIGLGKYYEVNDAVRARIDQETVKADSIEALAEKMAVPVIALKATVARYNDLARKGKDLDFGKRADRMTTIEKPPFYAGLVRQEFLVVLGGLNGNTRFQALDAQRRVIPGLYLAGNTVGNRFGNDYPTMCPGLSHGMAYVSGRLAGLYAAAEAGAEVT
ncbi:MAG: FAD-dependent oxidoreductase [Syntrophorhabdales bacterium]